jgi:hypothetical protein
VRNVTNERRVDVIKSNFARKPEPLSLSIIDHGLVWKRSPEPPHPQKPIEAARAYLLQALQGTARLSKELRDAALGKHRSSRPFDAAIESLKLRSFKEKGRDGHRFGALTNWKEDVTSY